MSLPLTPPVLQSQPLLAQHLPPPVLPFQNFATRVAETALEKEVAEEQQAARRVLEESEEQASHSHSATADELEQARTGGFWSSIFYSHLDSTDRGVHFSVDPRSTSACFTC